MSQQQKSVTLGKQELLAWAAATGGVTPCSKYDDLRDGLVLVALLGRIFPSVVPISHVSAQRSGGRLAKTNWALLHRAVAELGLPAHICDQKGITAGHPRPCYNMLVMMYFLYKLASSAEFTVDFSHPIDEGLAEFLESPQSVECLKRSGVDQRPVLSTSDGASSDSDSQAPPASPESSVAPRREAPLPSSRETSRRVAVSQPSATIPPAAELRAKPLGAISSTVCSWSSPETSTVGEVVIARLKQELRLSRTAFEALQRETEHARHVGRVALEQQRVLAQSEVARTQQVMRAESAVALVEARHQFDAAAASISAELRRSADAAAVELDHLRFDVLGTKDRNVAADVMFAELSALRQERVLLRSNVRALEQQLQVTRDAESRMQNVLAEQQASTERLHGLLAATCGRAKTIDDVVAAALKPSEAYSLAARLQQLESDLSYAQSERDRLAAQLQQAQEGDHTHRHDDETDSALLIETKRLQAECDRLKRVNAFLHCRGDTTTSSGGANDAHAEVLGSGTAAPSCVIGGDTVEIICGRAMQAVDALPDTVPGKDPLRQSFWSVTSGLYIMSDRVAAAADTIRRLYESVQTTHKELVVARHAAESLRLASSARPLSQSSAALGDAQVEVEQLRLRLALSEDEVQQLRKTLSSGIQKLLANSTVAMRDTERIVTGVVGEAVAGVRNAADQRQREERWQELTEALRIVLRSSGSRVAAADERRIEQLAVRVQEGGDDAVPEISRLVVDTRNEVKTAVAQLVERWGHAIREVTDTIRGDMALRERYDATAEEAELLKSDLRRSVTAAQEAEKFAKQLQVQLDSAVGAKAVAEGSLRAAEQELADERRLMNQQYAAAVRLLEGTRTPDMPKPPQPAPLPRSSVAEAANGHRAPLQQHSAQLHNPPPAPTEAVHHRPNQAHQPTRERAQSDPQAMSASQRPTSSGVLSPEELERRKNEILARYGMK